jgi:GTP cyclohydrolase I
MIRPMATIDRDAAARAVEAFLVAMGMDPSKDPELKGTPARVTEAWAGELLSGYDVEVDALLSENVIAGSSSVVVVRDIPVATTCPHHLMPSMGTATVAFGPDRWLIGVGTVGRVVDAYARRLALQEQIGEQVVEALGKHLQPRWVACRLVLSHACMTVRGERTHGARVETLAQHGEAKWGEQILAAVGLGR